MSLQDIVNEATAAALQAAYMKARADALKAAAVGEAERLRAEGAPVRELSSDQRLGTLRLDAAGLPAVPVIDKPDEVTSWLAEHAPHLVTASIRVPVDQLEKALDALEFHAGMAAPDVEARMDFHDRDAATRWIREHCIVQADPEAPRTWNVRLVNPDGTLTPVPGVSGIQPAPYWVVKTNDERKRDYVATAQSEVDELIRQLREQDAELARLRANGVTEEGLRAALADAADSVSAGS